MGHRTLVRVIGEVDILTAPVFRQAVHAVLLSSEHDIWIDLTEVEFMDSTGVDVLEHARRTLHRDDRLLAVIAPDGPARRVLEIVGLDRIVDVYRERPAARPTAMAGAQESRHP